MQVFGFQIGKSREPHRNFALEQLEIQPGAALNYRSPVWAQLFVHSQPAPHGKSWLVNQYPTVPQQLLFAETSPESMCTIPVDQTNTAKFKGRMCSFQSMCQLWRNESGPVNGEDRGGDLAIQTILLDATVPHLAGISSEIHNFITTKDTRYHGLADALVNRYGTALYILLVGRLLEATDDDEDEIVGLIAYQIHDQDKFKGQRLGLCLWTSIAGNLSEEGGFWDSVEVELS